MNSPRDRASDLQRLEEDIKKREQALRLRELEAEIDRPPLYQTVKHEQSEGKLQQWGRKLLLFGKFIAFVVAGIVVVRISTILAGIAIVGIIGFIGYKIFLEGDRNKD
ncbi:MAG TPA: hypothetical protein DEG17_25275 [Cyanobacteria bacterium UBA11149]|nr:hypothetical protein [Cyanobacteria bacterium UBA11367]HBE60913.1 hypothetical protein [Cyanobacteria bacterium UBA11366]HBK62145.1 hypothetical protein [Cyanobacteria bacterium UBA11166]HBR76621.1 hypothetical protein [Cyanobacteria bacterium UBA11159]HBS72382.1 hypothetical protein [Cyanobacteria bacterium UBA11153]HBW92089.1 hypothetical protein [Cyanobacteria bacterium UBA11149]HCA97067.1 hypothetical protein [Cyanobacteria bacterium UBA9226]